MATFKGAAKGVKLVSEKAGVLMIEVDTNGDFGISESQKTITKAGCQLSLDNGVTIGLNAYTKNPAYKKAAK